MKWLQLHRGALGQPRALDALAESAACALSASGNTEAKQAFVDSKDRLDLYALCSVLDAHSVSVPGDVASEIEYLSDL